MTYSNPPKEVQTKGQSTFDNKIKSIILAIMNKDIKTLNNEGINNFKDLSINNAKDIDNLAFI